MNNNVGFEPMDFADLNTGSPEPTPLNPPVKTPSYPPSVIQATDATIRDIVKEQIALWGNEADLNHIDVSKVTDMSWLFSETPFNGDVSRWDTSNVKNMRGMFQETPFDGDVSRWDVSNVNDMCQMFCESYFCGDISLWDTSNVQSMHGMFERCPFNGNISNWNVANVENMNNMFLLSEFNGDVSRWDVSNVKRMNFIFSNTYFNGDISKWNVREDCEVYCALDHCPAYEAENFGMLHVLNANKENMLTKDNVHPACEFAYALHKDGMSLDDAVKEGKAFYAERVGLVQGMGIEDQTEQAKMLLKLYQERNQAQPLIDFTMGLEPSEQAMGSSGFSFDAPDEQSTGLTI